uniref:ST3 beta-galactoside alpha-2,3-sialyltransferase 6 n=2 Tax=Xenopus tropicalis TaxID=8364 RepID=A0A6I8Q4Z5_XENTR
IYQGSPIFFTCLLVMRKFLFVGITFAALLHFMLHIFVQKKTISTLPTDAVKEFKSCYNEKFRLILNTSEIEPFLCQDFRKQSVNLGSNKLDLPYGIRRGGMYLFIYRAYIAFSTHYEQVKNPSSRMNDGPVLGYEDDVGRKTTFRLCYPESIFSNSLHYDPNSTVVLLMFKPHDVKWLSELLMHKRVSTYGFWRKPAMNLIYKPHQLRVLNPFILRQVSQNILNFPLSFPKTEKPKHPTTGIIAITLAFHICNEVHIAGFKYNLTSLNSSLHYYGNETMSVMAQNEYHNISAEQMFIRDLIEHKTIKNLT